MSPQRTWVSRVVFILGVAFGLFLIGTRVASADCDTAVKPGSILFVTDRAALPDAQLFSGERGRASDRRPVITYGVLGSPLDRKHLEPCSSAAAFFRAVGKRFAGSGSRRALIYAHGYYRSFVQGADAAMQFQRVLRFAGPVILYSWPSKVTSRLAYVNDETNAAWATPHFISLIGGLERAFPKLPISFFSHSMGARFAGAGFIYLREAGCKNCLGRSVLYAPDIDGDTLRDEFVASGLCGSRPAPRAKTAALVTLYVSNRDTALQASQKLHGHQRAGQAGSEMILCGGVNTIDVSRVPGADRAGHLYQFYPEILRDTAAAFSGVPPAYPGRKVKGAKRDGGAYFELER